MSSSYVYFGIYGDFNPMEFATKIAIQPDKCIAKHASRPDKKIPKTSILHYGQLETSSELINIYDLAERSVDILEPHLNSFTSTIRTYSAESIFQIVLYFPVSEDISTPILGFSTRVASFIASTGASIDIDTYRA